jgi:hypothetical protein
MLRLEFTFQVTVLARHKLKLELRTITWELNSVLELAVTRCAAARNPAYRMNLPGRIRRQKGGNE